MLHVIADKRERMNGATESFATSSLSLYIYTIIHLYVYSYLPTNYYCYILSPLQCIYINLHMTIKTDTHGHSIRTTYLTYW